MKKRVERIALIFSALVLLSTSAMGADIHDVQYDLETSTVTISGKTENKSETVTLEILQPGIEVEDLNNIEISNINQYIYRVDETEPNADGTFKFEFGMKANTGDYITRIYGQPEDNVLLYVSYTEYIDAFDSINSETTTQPEQIVDIIDTKGNLLGLVNSYYTNFDDNEKLKVASKILKDRNSQTEPDKKFKDSKSLIRSYNIATVLEAMRSTENVDFEILENNKELLGIVDCSAYKVYESFSESEKSSLVQVLKGIEYTDVDKFIEAFIEKTVFIKIKNTENYKDLYDILKDNNDVLGLNMDTFERLSEYNQSVVLRKITGNSYSDTEGLKKAFNGAISSLNQSNTSGGSGGGGSSSGSHKQGPTIKESPIINTTEKSKPFDDLSNVAWAEESIMSLFEKGIVSGKEQGKFYPMDFVKREEFVKMLISGLNIDTSTETNNFKDVDINMWYAPYVLEANKKELVNGIDDNKFGVGLNITRQDIVTILYRTSQMLRIEFPSDMNKEFVDRDEISEYAKKAVESLSSCGIINGNEYGEFLPQNNATRAEAAKILEGFLKFID